MIERLVEEDSLLISLFHMELVVSIMPVENYIIDDSK